MNNNTLRSRVARARSAIGKGTIYKLGLGGFDPNAAHPGQKCDCSGFAAWCLRLSRKPKEERNWWIETTAIVRDALSDDPNGVFAKIDCPVPGCLVVYPDRKTESRTVQGHVGIVSAVRSQKDFDIVDCSSFSYREHRDAIRERSGVFMPKKGAIFCTLRQDL